MHLLLIIGYFFFFRDIKAENVLISGRGHVQLCDLGVAKELGKEDRTKTIVGTPHYMAPEVNNTNLLLHTLDAHLFFKILLGEAYNHSVDYWSLGILAHELVNLAVGSTILNA